MLGDPKGTYYSVSGALTVKCCRHHNSKRTQRKKSKETDRHFEVRDNKMILHRGGGGREKGCECWTSLTHPPTHSSLVLAT